MKDKPRFRLFYLPNAGYWYLVPKNHLASLYRYEQYTYLDTRDF